VIAEHANGAISQGTLSTVTAALQIAPETSVLVAGAGADAAATAAAAIPGVSKVTHSFVIIFLFSFCLRMGLFDARDRIHS